MGVLSALVLASSAVSAVSSTMQARGMRRAANDAVNEGNRLAADAVARGEQEVRRYGFDLAKLMGRQRTAAAAQGIDATQGSAKQIAAQTTAFGEEDVRTIRENAMREAYGLKRQGQAQAAQLRSGATAAYGNAFANALSFGSNAWGVHQSRLAARTSMVSDAFRANPAMF